MWTKLIGSQHIAWMKKYNVNKHGLDQIHKYLYLFCIDEREMTSKVWNNLDK